MGVASRLKHRCTIQFNDATTKTGWNTPEQPNWSAHLDFVPCCMIDKRKRTALDSGKDAVIEDVVLLVGKNTDVDDTHRIINVRDRLDRVQWTGPYKILAVVKLNTHLQLLLKKVD